VNRALLVPAAYVGVIVAANLAVAEFGLIPIAPGLVAPAGVVFAGLALLLRDALPDRRLIVALIVLGAGLSALLSAPAVAFASAAAFLVSELVDWAVYELQRQRGVRWAWAAIGSNVVSAPLDTIAFLWLSGFGATAPLVAGQLVGKLLYATLLPVLIVAVVIRLRARRAVTA
jgi:uncharacterized PurR-regulated membrane protein YhhQ (DUF165 family)